MREGAKREGDLSMREKAKCDTESYRVGLPAANCTVAFSLMLSSLSHT